MQANDWFERGIAIRGVRSGVTEVMPEPYSARSAARLAKSYAAIWREAIEWWPVGVATQSWHEPFLLDRKSTPRPHR